MRERLAAYLDQWAGIGLLVPEYYLLYAVTIVLGMYLAVREAERNGLDHFVHALKYRGQLATARVLGTLLAGWLAGRGLQHGVDVIVPVPLYPARHAERGFNQSAGLARQLGRGLHLPVVESLAVRRRATSPQVGLDVEERRHNLAGAFGAGPVAGLRVAIVDDVTTTGSTLQELARALLQAGAQAVDAWCVARTDRSRIHTGARREPSPSAGWMR